MEAAVHNQVNKLRTERNITQEELANCVGVSRQTIIALEKGHYTPSVLLALKIAGHFKVPVEEAKGDLRRIVATLKAVKYMTTTIAIK